MAVEAVVAQATQGAAPKFTFDQTIGGKGEAGFSSMLLQSLTHMAEATDLSAAASLPVGAPPPAAPQVAQATPVTPATIPATMRALGTTHPAGRRSTGAAVPGGAPRQTHSTAAGKADKTANASIPKDTVSPRAVAMRSPPAKAAVKPAAAKDDASAPAAAPTGQNGIDVSAVAAPIQGAPLTLANVTVPGLPFAAPSAVPSAVPAAAPGQQVPPDSVPPPQAPAVEAATSSPAAAPSTASDTPASEAAKTALLAAGLTVGLTVATAAKSTAAPSPASANADRADTPPPPASPAAAQAAALAQLAGDNRGAIKVASSANSLPAASPLAPAVAVQASTQTGQDFQQNDQSFAGNNGDTGNGTTGNAAAQPVLGATVAGVLPPADTAASLSAAVATPSDAGSSADATTLSDPARLVAAGIPPVIQGEAGGTSAGAAVSGPDSPPVPSVGGAASPNLATAPQTADDPTALVGIGTAQAPGQTEGTTAAAPPAARPPVLPTPAEQIKVQLGRGLKEGNDTISVQLHPDDLGRVEVKLEMQNGQVKATITADRPETLQLLKNDAAGLQQSLQDAGLHADSNALSFELRGEQRQQQQTAGDGSAGRGRPGFDAEGDAIAAPQALAAALPRSPVAAGGVDISV